MEESESESDYDILYKLLANKNKGYYSLGIKYVSRLTQIPLDELKKLDWKTNSAYADIFESLYNDKINVFTFNNITYIGLETRRLDYNKDEILGINKIAKAVKRGDYD